MCRPSGAFLVSEIFPTAPRWATLFRPYGTGGNTVEASMVCLQRSNRHWTYQPLRRRADNANVLIRNRVRGAGAPPVRFQRRLFLCGFFGFLGFLGFLGFFGFLAAAGCAAAGAKGAGFAASGCAVQRSNAATAMPRPFKSFLTRNLPAGVLRSHAEATRICILAAPPARSQPQCCVLDANAAFGRQGAESQRVASNAQTGVAVLLPN